MKSLNQYITERFLSKPETNEFVLKFGQFFGLNEKDAQFLYDNYYNINIEEFFDVKGEMCSPLEYFSYLCSMIIEYNLSFMDIYNLGYVSKGKKLPNPYDYWLFEEEIDDETHLEITQRWIRNNETKFSTILDIFKNAKKHPTANDVFEFWSNL